MAQRIVTLCDIHQSRDEEVAGSPWSVTITGPGGKPSTFDVDLCDDDAKGLTDLLDVLRDVGRKAANPVGRPKTARAAPGVQPDTEGRYVCPECGKTSTHAQGLGSHRLKAHGVPGVSRAAGTRARVAASGGAE